MFRFFNSLNEGCTNTDYAFLSLILREQPDNNIKSDFGNKWIVVPIIYLSHAFGVSFVPSGKMGFRRTETHLGLPIEPSCDLYS